MSETPRDNRLKSEERHHMNPGIRLSLQILAETARRDSSEPLARDLTDAVPDIPGKVRALVDALHRSGARSSQAGQDRFVRAVHGDAPGFFLDVGCSDPVHISSVSVIDADDACLFVAAAAHSLGIPCRFVAMRFGERSWTVRLRYEVDGRWEEIDCMDQSTVRGPDEEIVGEELRKNETR